MSAIFTKSIYLLSILIDSNNRGNDIIDVNMSGQEKPQQSHAHQSMFHSLIT